jgi:predicted amidohydrolase
MQKYLVAMIQMDTGDDLEKNLAAMSAYIAEAAERGVSLITFPETVNFIGNRAIPGAPAPEDENGPTFRLIAGLAKKYGVYIHGGSWAEKKADDKRYYNTSFLFSPQGELLGRYRKLHTFDITLPDGSHTRESERVAPGNEIVTVKTELGVFGLSICYDLRFPELFRLLAVKGAEVILLPANFTLPTGKDHWEPLIRARAIENGCYIIATGQWGKKFKFTAYGNSLIADPWGTVTARGNDSPGIILGEIDLGFLDMIRGRMQTLENRRPDVYRLEEV